jgi:hypothetical protein
MSQQRSEQKRQAQARYRQVHAEKLRKARRIGHLLSRQTQHHGEVEELARLISDLVGKNYAREIGRKLVRR